MRNHRAGTSSLIPNTCSPVATAISGTLQQCWQVISLTAFAVWCCRSLDASDLRPNVILCMGDDHGWEETGYNGHTVLKTPVLDAMAATGLRMDHFYAGHPSCSPTRGSVLTGRHPNRYGTFAPNWSIRPEEITIAHLLGSAGYVCGHFGKWHLGPVKMDSPTNPGAMGFDEWVSHDNFFELNPSLSRNGGPPERFDGEGSEVIVDESIRFIKKAQQDDKPFLAVIWFGSPHEPYSGLQHDLALYDELPDEFEDRQVQLTSNETGSSVSRPLREVLRERYAEITAMDRAIGKLRSTLRDEGLRKNTLLWYCGDNGTPSSGLAVSPFRGQKGQMYEGGIRVPCVIEWPEGIPQPRVCDMHSVTSDILPTICAMAGVPLPDRPLDGINLLPAFAGELTIRPGPICFWSFNSKALDDASAKAWIAPELQQGTTPLVKLMNGRPTRTFQNFHHPVIREQDFTGARTIVNNTFKLVVHGTTADTQKIELFDLRHDPEESTDVSQSQADITGILNEQLRAWQESVLRSLTGADY